MKPLRRKTLYTDAKTDDTRLDQLERRFIPPPGALPVAYSTISGGQTLTDGQDYALTGEQGFFVGSNNAEGLATPGNIFIVNDAALATFDVNEALLALEPALYVFDAGVQFEDGGGFPAGVRATINIDAIPGTWLPFPGPSGFMEETIFELPVGEQDCVLHICALAMFAPGVVTTDKEFVIEVLVVGDDVDINGGWFTVCRLSTVPNFP